MMNKLGAAAVALLAVISASAYADITGTPRVIDGDTLEIGQARIRLFGIDAPEAKQTCTDAQGTEYLCGVEATNALRQLVGSEPIRCEERDRDRYHRIVAVCFAESVELNREMVREGWAVAYTRYSLEYVGEEAEAANNRRGIWAGTFQWPEEWRREHPR